MRVLARRRQLPEEVPEEFRTPTDPLGTSSKSDFEAGPEAYPVPAICFRLSPPTSSERVHTSSPEESSDATEHPSPR